jgi:hypothetical protein
MGSEQKQQPCHKSFILWSIRYVISFSEGKIPSCYIPFSGLDIL